MNVRLLVSLALASCFVGTVACSSDSTAGDDDGDDDGTSSSSGGASSSSGNGGSSGGASSSGGGSSGSEPADLACNSIALCTTNEVKTFLGDVPEAAGGAVQDGLYRLSWIVSGSQNEDRGGYFDMVEALLVQDGQFVWAGFHRDVRGTLTASGSTLTFKNTSTCYLGSEGDASTSELQYDFTATGSQLLLFGDVTGSESYRNELVYERVDGPGDVCDSVDAEPTTPGASMQCTVMNCGCNVKVNGVIDRDTCPS